MKRPTALDKAYDALGNHAQFCTELPSPPEATGMKSGFASQFVPQLQVIVSFGLQ